MKVRALRFLAASPLLLFLALVTCGRDSPTRSSGPYEVVVAPAKATLISAGQTVRLSATVRDQAGQLLTGADVRWSSGSPSVATVDGSGLVTARQSGTAVITASSGGVTGQATVTVEKPDPKTIAVTPDAATLTAPGRTVRLSATVRDQAGQPLTGSDVRWSSGNPSVATVDGSGLVTARQFGTAVITASSGGVTGQATVTVERSSTRSMSIAPRTATLNYWKETVQLTVTVYDGNGAPISGAAVSWSSGDENVATVDENGLVTAGRIGTTWITAAVGGATLQAAVSVAQTLKVNRIDLFIPGDVRLTPGDTWRIEAQAYDIDDKWLGYPAPTYTWSSDNPAVATVDGSGLVTAHGDGTARITAAVGYGAAKATETITVHNPDRAVLVALYHAADGPNWTNAAGWLGDDPVSTWHGVSVDAAGRVTRLSLEGNRLKGTIFPGLDRLAHLEVLSLGSNELRGPIPRELGGLSRLAELDLSYNRALAGPLPQALTRLGGLRVLHADGTGLCAPRNAAFQAWLQGIGDRRVAGCENRDREALIALYRAADGPNWTNAAGWLTDAPLNKWHGVTASESGWVTGLDLSDNNLSGAVPAALGGLGGLTALNLSFNALSGPVPVPLSLLGLESLLLEGTGLCAPLSAAFQAWLQGIPDHRVAGCEDREALIALYHAADGPNWTNAAGWLTDAPLNEWHGVTAGEDGRVTGLNLGDNGLSGPIPVELGYLDQLRHLDFRFNRLTGPIPVELGYLDQLRSLDLGDNRLSGRIPPVLGGLRRLQELYLDGNGLNGPGLSGPIPRELGDLDQLQDLRLSRNNLTGALPSELGRLTNLWILALHNNELSGPIPPELSRLDRLRQLYLRDNGLSGPIPRALGDLDQLVLLDLGNNPLSGPVPLALSRLSPFYTLYLDGTQTCILPDAGFQAWLQGPAKQEVARPLRRRKPGSGGAGRLP